MDYLCRLPPIDPYADREERWLVRDADGETRVAWIFGDDDRDFLTRSMAATTAWIGFSHPRVSRVVACRWIEDRAVFVVDDDRGPTLIDATAQLPADERERWAIAQVIAIADGLVAMRARDPDFVHRRLEPQRIFVDASGHARLRAPVQQIAVGPPRSYVGAGRVVGTPEYMAPEQARGLPCTAATDVYALATNLVHALTGRSPYARDTTMEALVAILEAPAPVVPGASPAFASVLARAFEKDAAARFAGPAAFAVALRAAVPDAHEVDAVISDRIAAWWPTAEPARGAHELFGGGCKQVWGALEPTRAPGVRHCATCRQLVVAVDSPLAVLPLVGRCVSSAGS